MDILKTLNFDYEILEDNQNKKIFSISQIDFNNGKIAGIMTYIPLGRKKGLKLIEKGIRKFIGDYKIKKTMCHHTLKCVVCYRHLFLGCSEIEYKQYTTS